MKVVFYASDKSREIMLAEAMRDGMSALRETTSIKDDFEIRRTGEFGEDEQQNDLKYPGPSPDTDVAVFFGVKGKSGLIMREHLAVGKTTIYLDKGFTRQKGEGGHTEYSRVAINGVSPAPYMMAVERPNDRWRRLDCELQNRQRNNGGHVLLCMSSSKYHEFHELTDADEYALKRVKEITKLTNRQIVYRPKPSNKRPTAIPGASLSLKSSTIQQALRGAYCVVTHGATSAVEAICNGIPAICLGECVASPVAESDLGNIEKPFFPKDAERQKWAHALAYCQFTTQEMRDGVMWANVRQQIVATKRR